MGFKILFALLIVQETLTIDLLPCTDGVSAADMALAQQLIGDATPLGYRLIDIESISQTGRNPHRWLGRFERIDNVYNYDCDYLTAARTVFRRICPRGSEISQIGVAGTVDRQCIMVQYLVHCGCRRVPRRKKRNIRSYIRESSTCSGIPEYHQG